jgi:L-threonylcarbamoyladenylate synthase
VSALAAGDARRLERCVREGGVAVFPADTVYGLCCDPESERAVRRLYELKGRPPERPAAVMFFSLPAALEALPELSRAPLRTAAERLLPGPVTLLLHNPRGRYPLACGPDPGTLGVRVPRLPEAIAALATVSCPVMQSSANLSGGADARTLAEVPLSILAGADLVLDGGELGGRPSTVLDLRDYRTGGAWRVLREGALTQEQVADLLATDCV